MENIEENVLSDMACEIFTKMLCLSIYFVKRIEMYMIDVLIM